LRSAKTQAIVQYPAKLRLIHSAAALLRFRRNDLGRLNVMPEPLEARPDLLEKKILDRVAELIRYSPELRASLSDLIAALKE